MATFNIPAKSGSALGMGCLIMFALPFAGAGVFTFVTGVKKLLAGEKDGWPLLLFGLVFGGVGFGLMIGALLGGRTLMKRARLREQNPGAPWLWREDWASGLIPSDGKSSAIGAWVFALFWNGISSMVFFVVPRELAKGDKAVLIALIFPVIGVGLLVWAVRATLRWRKFGQSVFKMISVPGVIGGGLAGGIRIPHKLQATDGVRVRLLCLRKVTTGSGENSSTTETPLWEEEKTITKDPESDPRYTIVPVFFQIPPGLPATDSSGRREIIWRLEATAKVPGIDYFARFALPVFVTGQSRTATEPLPDPTARFQAPAASWQPPPSRIRVKETLPGGVEIYYPPARNPGTILFLTAFLFVWSTVIGFMVAQKAPVIFAVVFGLFDLIFLLVWAGLLFKSTRVVAESGSLAITQSWFGLGTPRAIPAADVASINLTVGMTSGSQAYYDLQVVTRAGKKLKAGGAIGDKRHAEWLAEKLRAALALKQPQS